jgi:site-specific recombinase XerD
MREEIQSIFDAFLAYETARGSRPRGVKELRAQGRRFLEWLDEEGLDFTALDRKAAKAYLAHVLSLTTQGGTSLAAHTVRAYVQAAGRFARYLVYCELIPADPFSGLKLPRAPKLVLRNVPTEGEMEKALALLADWEAVGPDTRLQARRYLAHLVAELQYASGLRIAEVAELELSDIDLEKRRVRVRAGKKGKSRVAYLTEYAAKLLSIYVDRMRPLVLTAKQDHNPDKLFGAGFEALSHFQNAHLEAISCALGMKLTSHSFRHALGYHLLRAGCPLRQIQEILGHERIKDTEVYTKVDEREVQEVLDEYHPRGREVLGNAG